MSYEDWRTACFCGAVFNGLTCPACNASVLPPGKAQPIEITHVDSAWERQVFEWLAESDRQRLAEQEPCIDCDQPLVDCKCDDVLRCSCGLPDVVCRCANG